MLISKSFSFLNLKILNYWIIDLTLISIVDLIMISARFVRSNLFGDLLYKLKIDFDNWIIYLVLVRVNLFCFSVTLVLGNRKFQLFINRITYRIQTMVNSDGLLDKWAIFLLKLVRLFWLNHSWWYKKSFLGNIFWNTVFLSNLSH